jgi:hypothetical protein
MRCAAALEDVDETRCPDRDRRRRRPIDQTYEMKTTLAEVYSEFPAARFQPHETVGADKAPAAPSALEIAAYQLRWGSLIT